MENKYRTLQTIYDLVKSDPNPVKSIVEPSQIILRQHIPWDEIVKHLDELQSEGLVIIKPMLSTSAISITDSGLRKASLNADAASVA